MKTAKNSVPNLISPCGMNCALCASYLALKNDVKSKGIRMPYCTGCRPLNKQCAFIKKACSRLQSGEIAYCFECASFPCHRLKVIDHRYKTRYRMSMIENLHFIEQNGMQQFLAEQKRLWRCPNCGEMICCHNGICFKCSLDTLKSRKEKYRWQDKQ